MINNMRRMGRVGGMKKVRMRGVRGVRGMRRRARTRMMRMMRRMRKRERMTIHIKTNSQDGSASDRTGQLASSMELWECCEAAATSFGIGNGGSCNKIDASGALADGGADIKGGGKTKAPIVRRVVAGPIPAIPTGR